MKSLFLAWQAPEGCLKSRAWFPIGRLDAEVQQSRISSCRFRYTHGAERAHREVGFEPLVSFPHFKVDYRSEKLFPIFQNRVLSPKRPDFPEYIDWLGLTEEQADPISILSVSQGLRLTDNLQTFPKVEAEPDGSFQLRFFVHGLRYLNSSSKEKAMTLQPGAKLRIMIEVNNPATRLAVTLHTEDYTMIGWAPRYLVDDLVTCIGNAPQIEVTVVKINQGHAPPNQAILVEYSGKAPANHDLMSSLDLFPLVG
ncbi:hypothetical protein OVA24_00445 [Luteolibacter sp. SL250]|uniref:hypothetical protein n=1 Tax=Luteolibacter sp. SL250 TaxID=2995170 RepID=UPI00226EE9BB|nr:hypothetical protein [Luteolibacter sp. SL250]WAC19844.1 hypothetical protein OVA24_00445 [Luteolibacter sp. SL250]